MWSVELWSINPHEEGVELEGQCISGAEFGTREHALECFLRPEDFFDKGVLKYAVFVAYDWDEKFDARRIMSEEDEKKLRALQERERRLDERMERSEAAMQAGMGGGCEAYNEAMGFDMSEPDGYGVQDDGDEAGNVDPTPEDDQFDPCGDTDCLKCDINCPYK